MGRNKKNLENRKKHLTINIDECILNKIDEIIEKSGDKRSGLIEKLLNDYIENKSKL